ncbi:MAG TPA: hypothetical protein ENH80_03550 [Phycisphaerae bacterium]|nr:hypothetical protein [Phycisphaerae bacterium]
MPDRKVTKCEGGLSLETDDGRTSYKLSFSRSGLVRFDRNHENNRNERSQTIMIPLGEKNAFCLQIFDKQVAIYVNGKLVVYKKDLIDPPLDSESQLTLTCHGGGRRAICQFTDLHYRTLDRMPPKGQIGVGDPSTQPAGPMFAGYDDVPAESELDRTTPIGSDEGMPFEDVLRGPGWLAGVRLGLQASADAPITTIQPVYRTPTGRHLGPTAGRSDREVLEIAAPAGYAVGALRIHGDKTLTGVSVVFMRVLADGRLDAGSARTSAVYGWGEVSKTLGGDGRAIVGLAGRMGEGVSALGVVTAETLNLAGMCVDESPAPLAREPLPEFILRPGGDVAKLGGSYYRYVDIPLTWAQAKRRCEAMGGRLAVFDSGVVNSYLLYLAGGRAGWIGLSKPAGRDKWQWLDGRVAEGGHWRQGAEAVDAADAFAYVGWRGTGAWEPARESDLLGFICQWDDDPRPPDRRKATGLAIDVSGDDVIYKGHRYRLFNQGVTWARAKAICKSWGGHLITIDSDEENTVAFILAGGQLTFIGASDDEVEGDWRWVDGRPVTHANWAAGEPNNTDGYQHVALIGFGGAAEWDDVAPTGVTVFLCEWDSADEPTELGLDAIVTETAGAITDAIGHSGQWYKAYYEAVTWDQAHQICARLGGRLIQIDSQATNDLATMFTRQSQPMWIDAHRPTDEAWETAQGKALDYTNWLTTNEGAGIYGPPAATILFEVPYEGPRTRGKWRAVPAARAYGFICQWDHNPGEGADTPAPATDAAEGSDDEPSEDTQTP